MHYCTRFLLVGLAILLIPARVMADEISVTGSIAAKTDDTQFELQRETSAQTVAENETVTYRVTYGSRLYYGVPVRLEAAWDPGIVQGTGQNVSILEYRSGSATAAYGSTPAVIDLINRKITWDIPALPSRLQDQTVTFSLVTNTAYVSQRDVSFKVRAKATIGGVTVPEQSVITLYRYGNRVTPTPISSQETSSVAVTLTPSPTPAAAAVFPQSFNTVSLRSLTSSSLGLAVEMKTASSLVVAYSRTPTGPAQQISLPLSPQLTRLVDLDKLEPDTSYYVRITATDSGGKQYASDLFVFKTAIRSLAPEVAIESLLVTSDNRVLLDGKVAGTSAKTYPAMVVPVKQTLVIKFSLVKGVQARKVQAAIRNRSVLGISTDDDVPDSGLEDAFEVATGTYVVTYKTPPRPGAYEIVARIEDTSGNIVERKVANLNVSEGFMVLDSVRKTPVEAVQVTLYIFNSRTGKYVLLPPQLYSIKNPSLTDSQGQVRLLLPPGKYLAALRAIGYGEKQTTFSLGSDSGEGYPRVYLVPQAFSIGTAAGYYWEAASDVAAQSRGYLVSLSGSNRFFELNAFVATALLVILSLFSFSSRLHIPVRSLFAYLSHHGNVAVYQRENSETVEGVIRDSETKETVADAEVFLIDIRLDKTVSHTKTDSGGRFRLHTLKTRDYRIEVRGDGYERAIFDLGSLQADEGGIFALQIGKGRPAFSLIQETGDMMENFLSLIFELLLAISLIFEMSLGSVFGWGKAAPFIAISCINLLGWLMHLTHLKRLRER